MRLFRRSKPAEGGDQDTYEPVIHPGGRNFSLMRDEDVWREIAPHYRLADPGSNPRSVPDPLRPQHRLPVRLQAERPDRMLAQLRDAALAAIDAHTQKVDEPEWASEAAEEWRRDLGMLDWSAFDWLAGSHLYEVYRRHFGQEATVRTADGEPDTSFIRFVEAACKEMGVTYKGKPYARETIVRALTHVRKGKKRRHGKVGNSA